MHTIKLDGHKYFIHLAQAKGNRCGSLYYMNFVNKRLRGGSWIDK